MIHGRGQYEEVTHHGLGHGLELAQGYGLQIGAHSDGPGVGADALELDKNLAMDAGEIVGRPGAADGLLELGGMGSGRGQRQFGEQCGAHCLEEAGVDGGGWPWYSSDCVHRKPPMLR